MKVAVTPKFRRQFKKLPIALQEEALDKIDLFEHPKNHTQLHVHKLLGRMNTRYSFHINYRYRIVFTWEQKNEYAILLAIGDHAIYQ